jgi:hypothetical protein
VTNIGTLTIDGANSLSLASGGMLCATNVDLKNGGTIDLLEGERSPDAFAQLPDGGLFNCGSRSDQSDIFSSSDGKGVFNANKRYSPCCPRQRPLAFTCIVEPRVQSRMQATVEVRARRLVVNDHLHQRGNS